jgi:chitin disaccharide deacetylase
VSVAALALERRPFAAGTRFLVVNADDFGMSDAVNRGVIRAHEHGIVTSTSLMVDRAAVDEAVAYARAHPRLSVGLHLDLSEWEYRTGEWHCRYERVSLDDATEVAAEVDRQLARFEELVGRPPTHIDSHQHVHRGAVVGWVVSERARALRIAVRHLSPGVRYRGDFYGQTSKGDRYPEWITPAALVEILGGLAAEITELGCHPAAWGPTDDAYAAERVLELTSLCDPAVLDAVLAQGITLVSFADVAEIVDHDVDAWRRGFEERSAEAAAAGDHADAESWLGLAVEVDAAHVGSWVALAPVRSRRSTLREGYNRTGRRSDCSTPTCSLPRGGGPRRLRSWRTLCGRTASAATCFAGPPGG